MVDSSSSSSSSSSDIACVPLFSDGYIFPVSKARTTGYEYAYPHDVHPLIHEHTKYPDVDSITSASYKNRGEFQKELTSMTKLSSKLDCELGISYAETKYLSEEQMFLCGELAKKVPGITKMRTFVDISGCQQTTIRAYFGELKRREMVATYNPQAQVLRALLVSYNAEQLAQILKVPIYLTEKLKNKLPKTFDDPPIPAQLPKTLTATQFRDCHLKAIQGVLQVIFLNMTMHQERISSCLELIRIVNHYIKGLRLRLGILKKEAVKVVVTSKSEVK
ncbi:hypothetical protein MKX03_009760 [Papaver bracteatum]|nr:hypothetical protein MKX03_009760 [Papaver bracteatum]